MGHQLRNIYQKDKKNFGFKKDVKCHGKNAGLPDLKEKKLKSGNLLYDVIALLDKRKK